MFDTLLHPHPAVRVISVLSFSRFLEAAANPGIQDPEMQGKYTMVKKNVALTLPYI